MKKLLLLIFLGLNVILFCGFNPYQQLPPIIENPDTQQTIYIDGHKALISTLSNSTVGIYSFVGTDGALILNIACHNTTDKPIDFIPENFKIYGTNETDEKIPLSPFSYNTYANRVVARNTSKTTFWINGGFFTIRDIDKAEIKEQTQGFLKANTVFPKTILSGYLPVHFYYGKFKRSLNTKEVQDFNRIKTIVVEIPIEAQTHQIKFAFKTE
jgi:hypothetical protein